MILEKIPTETKESGGELEKIIADIRDKANLIEGKEDAQKLLKKIKECDEKCNELDYDQSSEKREELRELSMKVLRQLRRFETADKEELNKVLEKVPQPAAEIQEVKEELKNIKKQAA